MPASYPASGPVTLATNLADSALGKPLKSGAIASPFVTFDFAGSKVVQDAFKAMARRRLRRRRVGDRDLSAAARLRQTADIVAGGRGRPAMPVFAAGVGHRGPYKNGPGEIHFPIAIDGMVIESDDMIVADEDGIVCVPLHDAEAVCGNAEAIAKREQTIKPIYDAERIDGTLKSLGCEFQ